MSVPDYFTLSEFRAWPDMDDTSRFSDADVEEAAAYVTAVIERVTGRSFVYRTITETVTVANGGAVLSSPYARTVTAAAVAGSPVDFASMTVGNGVLAWTGSGALTVTYTAGYSELPPDDIRGAAMQATRDRLLRLDEKSALSDRRQGITNDFGNVTFTLASEDRPFGLPEVDAVVLGWRGPSFGFA